MKMKNPLREDEFNYIEEKDGKLFFAQIELKELTEEQKKQTKTGANYYFENDKKINDSSFFCHYDKEKELFWIAETIDKNSHTVWLPNMKAVTYYEENIVLRDYKENTHTAFQNPNEMEKLSIRQYIAVEYVVTNQNEMNKKIDESSEIIQKLLENQDKNPFSEYNKGLKVNKDLMIELIEKSDVDINKSLVSAEKVKSAINEIRENLSKTIENAKNKIK